MFLALLALSLPLAFWLPWHEAMMAGFDIAALAFLVTVAPLISNDAGTMRRNAERNDANRELMLLLTGIVSVIILIAVGVAVSARGGPKPVEIALLLSTLALAWLFTNMVYALHYAHIFYVKGVTGKDSGGIAFPATREPRYWDFIYFAFTLGMTFQTSDVAIRTSAIRKIVTYHCLAAFVFNLGIIAFTINVLGGG
ncbi:DUF1345 domain-containing protein [Sphingobium aquiterrae]|uniref:DUF1345 domain-containing protein n=1 Tax=Sphingobium aquiterrae TaxID=2038656 RepID=UPI00301A3A9A